MLIIYPGLKLNHTVYVKNPFPEYFRNGTVKKQSQYIQVDLEHIMNNLKPGQTYEIKRSLHWKESKNYSQCVIIYRLTDKQIQERRKKQSYT